MIIVPENKIKKNAGFFNGMKKKSLHSRLSIPVNTRFNSYEG